MEQRVWKFEVGSSALVRGLGEWQRIEQRRLDHGRNAYRMEDGRICFEDELAAMSDFKIC